MGRKNRRSKRSKMNRRSKRTKMNRRTNMSGGADRPAIPRRTRSTISMTVKNVGTQVVYLSWWRGGKHKWGESESEIVVHPGKQTKHITYTGHQWRVKGNGNELSWVLADDDGSTQEIHVDFSPSKCSLTWNPSDDVGEAGLVQTDADLVQTDADDFFAFHAPQETPWSYETAAAKGREARGRHEHGGQGLLAAY
jgi:hypothetical protein